MRPLCSMFNTYFNLGDSRWLLPPDKRTMSPREFGRCKVGRKTKKKNKR